MAGAYYQSHTEYLREIVKAQKAGAAVGIHSICSSNPFVLKAAMGQVKKDNHILLVECTSNQVNQYGGYMGLTPSQFMAYIKKMADHYQLLPGQIILGGDHLGPNVWKDEIANVAMEKAMQMVREYVLAGFEKIHLDASMKLKDDSPGPLPVEVAARRAAKLCQAAETAYQRLIPNAPPLCYVIGTEVPPPGGAQQDGDILEATTVESAKETIATIEEAFKELGLQEAYKRVIALVVQPGVEFSDRSIHHYRRAEAKALAEFIERVPDIIYEVHSTDYQTRPALRSLVEDHFAILKVGPALTFAFREAVFALEMIEKEIMAGNEREQRSNLQDVLDAEMQAYSKYWLPYSTGTSQEQRFSRRYGFSDRVRYYWNRPNAQRAINRLITNLLRQPIPLSLISQFLPDQFKEIQQGELAPLPYDMIYHKIRRVLDDYLYACGLESHPLDKVI